MLRTLYVAVAGLLMGATLMASPAQADTVDIDGSTSTSTGSSTVINVPVPDGVEPVRITGNLTVDSMRSSVVSFVIQGRLAARAAARSGATVSIPVSTSDVEGGQIQVAMQVTDAATADGSDYCTGVDDTQVTFSDATLAFRGSEALPTSLGTFFASYATDVDVVVDADAEDDEIAAGLAAVASISSRYPATTSVHLTTSAETLKSRGAGHRVVRIEATDGVAETNVTAANGIATLTLTGDSKVLAPAARALSSDALGLANGARTEGLTATGAATPTTDTLNLADLGVEQAVLSGYGRVEQYIGIRQDAFGGQVGSLDLHLTGTHTALPEGAQAQLDVYFNDKLVESTQLDEDPALALDINVPSSSVRGDNGLVLVLSGIPPTGWCTGTPRQLPLEVDLDTGASTVKAGSDATRLKGFAAFPLALGGKLPVAIAKGRTTPAERVDSAIDAGYLVAALQREATRPLQVSLVGADDLLDGDDSGLLVGARESESTTLKSPLRLSKMRLLHQAEATFQVGTDQPFAALVAVTDGGRDVLMLGSWAPDATGPALERVAARTVASEGWGGLSADLLIASADTEPFSLDSNAVVPQEERIKEADDFRWWFLGGLLILIALLGVRWLVTRRRKRTISELVDAQVQADNDVAEDVAESADRDS